MHKYVLEILKELDDEPSLLAKEEIIKQYKNHPEFMLTLKYALDPLRLFHIKKIPDYKVGKPYITLPQAINKLDALTARQVTGAAASKHLQDILECVDFQDAVVLEYIIKKDLRCHVGAKLVNKALGENYIPVPVYSGCNKFDDKTIAALEFPAYAQTKMDGLFVHAIMDRNNVRWITRNMKELTVNNKVLNQHVRLVFGPNKLVYGGELLVVDEKGDYLPRKTGNGIINSLSKGSDKYADRVKDIRYVVWDIIPVETFRQEKHIVHPYSVTHDFLTKLPDNSLVKYVETIEVADRYEAEQFYEKQLSLKREGAVIKSKNHLWKNGRGNSMLKMKNESDADMRITAVLEGTGRLVGKLGKFVVSLDDGSVVCSVGTGFSDEQREEYYTDDMIGQIVELKYNERSSSKSKDKVDSLSHPVFVCVRTDKDTTNI